MTEPNNEQFLDACARAFVVFAELHPEYKQTESEARAMVAELTASGLSPADPTHLSAAWIRIRPRVPAAVTPEPEVAESTDPIEVEAHRLLSSGEVTVQSVRAMSSHELEMRIRNLAFCRALELLPKPAPEPIRTRGDVVIAEGRKNHANKNGIILDYDPVAAVEASRRAVAEGYANSGAAPASLPRGTSRSVVNLNQSMHVAKPQPSLQTCLSQEKKDHKWLEEQRTKSARAIRVRANRGKA